MAQLVLAAPNKPKRYGNGAIAIRAIDYMAAPRSGLSSGVDSLASSGTAVVDNQYVTGAAYPPSFATYYDLYTPFNDALDTLVIDLSTLNLDDNMPEYTACVSMRVTGNVVATRRNFEAFNVHDRYSARWGWRLDTQASTTAPRGSTGSVGAINFPIPHPRIPHYSFTTTHFLRSNVTTWYAQDPLIFPIGYDSVMRWKFFNADSDVTFHVDQIIFLPYYQQAPATWGIYQLGFGTPYFLTRYVDQRYEDELTDRFSYLDNQREFQKAVNKDDVTPSAIEITYPDQGGLVVENIDYDYNGYIPPSHLTITAQPRWYYNETLVEDTFARTTTGNWGTSPQLYNWMTGCRPIYNGVNSTSTFGCDGTSAYADFTSQTAAQGGKSKGAIAVLGFPSNRLAAQTSPGAHSSRLNLSDFQEGEILCRTWTSVIENPCYYSHAGLVHDYATNVLDFHTNNNVICACSLHWDGTVVRVHLNFYSEGRSPFSPFYTQWPKFTIYALATPVILSGVSPSDKVWIKIRYLGITVLAKAWKDGTTEPSSWTLSGHIPGSYGQRYDNPPGFIYTGQFDPFPYDNSPTGVGLNNTARAAEWFNYNKYPMCGAQSPIESGGVKRVKTHWDHYSLKYVNDVEVFKDSHLRLVDDYASVIPVEDIKIPKGAGHLVYCGVRDWLHKIGSPTNPELDRGVDVYGWTEEGASNAQSLYFSNDIWIHLANLNNNINLSRIKYRSWQTSSLET